MASFLAGSCSGSIITAGSCPFELVKVSSALLLISGVGADFDLGLLQVRRQLEVMIAQEMGVRDPTPLSTRASINAIIKVRGWRGMYTGFGAHSSDSSPPLYLAFILSGLTFRFLFRLVRDTFGSLPLLLPFSPSYPL